MSHIESQMNNENYKILTNEITGSFCSLCVCAWAIELVINENRSKRFIRIDCRIRLFDIHCMTPTIQCQLGEIGQVQQCTLHTADISLESILSVRKLMLKQQQKLHYSSKYN